VPIITIGVFALQSSASRRRAPHPGIDGGVGALTLLLVLATAGLVTMNRFPGEVRSTGCCAGELPGTIGLDQSAQR